MIILKNLADLALRIWLYAKYLALLAFMISCLLTVQPYTTDETLVMSP
jgi:hypothetical protein